MAFNAASHNSGKRLVRAFGRSKKLSLVAGVKTGPITEQPPQASSEAMSDLLGSSQKDPMGQHQGGRDGGDKNADKKVKSEKERTDPESIQLDPVYCWLYRRIR